MNLSGTDREEVALERLKDAQKALQELIEFAEDASAAMANEIERGSVRCFPISWGTVMTEKLAVVICEISRCNGALLVRSTAGDVAVG